MQAHIVLTHFLAADGVKIYFLMKVVMLHINLKGMKHREPCKHIFCPYTHPWLQMA